MGSLEKAAAGISPSARVTEDQLCTVLGYARALNWVGKHSQAKDLVEPHCSHLSKATWGKVGAAISLATSLNGMNKA